jgi:hypothetical protein
MTPVLRVFKNSLANFLLFNDLELELISTVFERCSTLGGCSEVLERYGAGDRDRTGDIQLGKLAVNCKQRL